MPVVLIKTRDLHGELRTFIALLQRCVGPRGKSQLISSAAYRPRVTSVSSRLLPELLQTTSHPLLAYLLQAAQGQIQRFNLVCKTCLSFSPPDIALNCIPNFSASSRYQDGGLWTCICAGLLLESAIKDGTLSIMHDLGCYGLSLLSHSSVRVEVALDSVRPLLSIATSVLKSKPNAFGVACSDVSTVALAVVKGFIETAGTVQNLVVQGQTGLGEPRVFPGLLWRATEGELALLRRDDWENVSVVLVSRMLTDLKDPLEKVEENIEIEGISGKKLESACRLVKLVAKAGIRILACQRVIDAQATLLAQRSGILVLPRLGRQFAKRLEQISGAKAIREDPGDVTPDLIQESRGMLTNVCHETVGGHDFLLLGGNAHTLLIHAPTAESSAELNAVVNQALTALTCAVSDSAVLPGAGCIEVWLCAQLWKKVVDLESEKKLSALRSVQVSLLSAAGMDLRGGTFSVDSQVHHAWECSSPHCVQIVPETRCMCGLVDAASLGEDAQWTVVNELGAEPLIDTWNPLSVQTRLQLKHGQFDFALDTLSAKRNAFKLALETASTLSHVGATLL